MIVVSKLFSYGYSWHLIPYCVSVFIVHWVMCCWLLSSALWEPHQLIDCGLWVYDAYWYLQSGSPTRKTPGSESNFLMAQFCILKIQWAVLKLVVDEYCMINLFCSSLNPRRMNENMNQKDSWWDVHQQALSAIFWCLPSYAQ